jgi:hypothetical protein
VAAGHSAGEDFNDWLTTRYYAPSDDANQPVDAPAAAQFNAILVQLAERVANAPERPHWNSGSFFRRFASSRCRRSYGERGEKEA